MLWRWKLLFLAFVVAAPLVAYFVVRGQAKVYESSTVLSISTASVQGANGTAISTGNLDAIARIATTSNVANVAAQLIKPDTLAGTSVSASADQNTNFITITADAGSPTLAANVANAYAKALGTNRSAAAIAAIDAQIASLQQQLAAVPAGPAGAAARSQLQPQLQQLRTERGQQSGQVGVVQAAGPNATPISPHIRRTVELGLVIGLLLGLGAVALAENADRRLRDPADLEELTKLPLLSAIPTGAFSAPLESTGNEEESFQMLRAALMYFNIDKRLSTIVITSPGQKDGKTTVAIRLALATVRAGKRVVLVDGDLRRIQVTERLAIRAEHGLGDVLIGEAHVRDVLIDHPVNGTKGGSLAILPGGHPPPNPSELLSSQEMRNLLRELESSYDLVIVDTPAALAVSDPLPLLPVASGVVLIARVNSSTRDAIRRLLSVITAADGTIVGVVATGVGSGGPGYYEYKYGYSTNGTSAKRPAWPPWRRRRPAGFTPPEADKRPATPRELSDV